MSEWCRSYNTMCNLHKPPHPHVSNYETGRKKKRTTRSDFDELKRTQSAIKIQSLHRGRSQRRQLATIGRESSALVESRKAVVHKAMAQREAGYLPTRINPPLPAAPPPAGALHYSQDAKRRVHSKVEANLAMSRQMDALVEQLHRTQTDLAAEKRRNRELKEAGADRKMFIKLSVLQEELVSMERELSKERKCRKDEQRQAQEISLKLDRAEEAVLQANELFMEKDSEILSLRAEVTKLERQLEGAKRTQRLQSEVEITKLKAEIEMSRQLMKQWKDRESTNV